LEAAQMIARIIGALCAALPIALLAGSVPVQAQVSEAEGLKFAKKISTAELDAGLKSEPFGDWIAEVAGAQAGLTWEMNDCGEQTGDPATDNKRDIPVCVSVDAELPDRRNIAAMILVGTRERGLAGKPAIYDLYWAEGTMVHRLRRLNELPAVVRSRPEETSE